MKLFLILNLFIASISFGQTREIDSLKTIVKSGKADTVKLKALSDLNWLFLTTDITKSKEFAYKELTLAKKIKHQQFIAQGYNDLGLSYYRLGLLDSALAVFNSSLEIRKKINDKNLIASSLSKISLIYNERGDYNDALKIQFETLKTYEELGIKNNQAIVLNAIANTYEQLKNSKKSIEYNQRALNLHLGNKNNYQVGITYNNIGNSYATLLNYKEAESYFNKALLSAKKMNDRQFDAAVYNGLARVFRELKQNEKALDYYKKAFDISLVEKNKVDIELYRKNICAVLIDLKKYEEAKAIALQSLSELDAKNKNQLKVTYRLLAIIYSYSHQGDLAKQYVDKFVAINDSIYSENSAIEIANAEKKYETEKKENENKLLLQQNNIKTLENDKKQQTIFILIACIIIATIIVLWQLTLARLKKQKRALETEQKLQQDRERISRDLHDNVGGQLSYVMFSLEANEEQTKEKREEKSHTLANALRSVTGNLRETIWALNKEKLTVQDISDKLKVYTRTMFAYTNTKLKFDENITNDSSLEPAFALNVFRICQEIINNVFKHAQASELTITISKHQKTMIIITDNGMGFTTQQANSDSYGLTNLHIRATEINATLKINTLPNKGTSITLIV